MIQNEGKIRQFQAQELWHGTGTESLCSPLIQRHIMIDDGCNRSQKWRFSEGPELQIGPLPLW